MDRRSFLKSGISGLAGIGFFLDGEPLRAATEMGPYGSIQEVEPDENGFLLPEGFKSKVVAVGGDLIKGTDYQWHLFPSGAGTIPDGNNGWFLASNSEVSNFLTPDETWGGASSIHFDSTGSVIGAHPILAWSHSNSGGTATPWGTWLSCESDLFNEGKVWECDPRGVQLPTKLEGIGSRNHGGIAIDPIRKCLYITENHREGLFYRYSPSRWPDLVEGSLEAMKLENDRTISWIEVPNPLDSSILNREKVSQGKLMPGGRACWYEKDFVYFSTRLDNRVHAIDLLSNRYEIIWDGENGRQPLTGIDDLTVDPLTGDVFVAETNGNMELVVISPEGSVSPFCRIVDPRHEFSALTGPCFDPYRNRLYISSQRGEGSRLVRDVIPAINWGSGSYGSRTGVTYEISGPFRTIEKFDTQSEVEVGTPSAATATSSHNSGNEEYEKSVSPVVSTTEVAATTSTLKLSASKTKEENSIQTRDSEGSNSSILLGSILGAVIFLGAGAVAVRSRSPKSDEAPS